MAVVDGEPIGERNAPMGPRRTAVVLRRVATIAALALITACGAPPPAAVPVNGSHCAPPAAPRAPAPPRGCPPKPLMNSLRMSFWMVPESFSGGTHCSSPATIKPANTGSTAPFMVIDTLISSSGMPSNRIFMSSTESMATPALPTSPMTRG